jgi:hypothetical protein
MTCRKKRAWKWDFIRKADKIATRSRAERRGIFGAKIGFGIEKFKKVRAPEPHFAPTTIKSTQRNGISSQNAVEDQWSQRGGPSKWSQEK